MKKRILSHISRFLFLLITLSCIPTPFSLAVSTARMIHTVTKPKTDTSAGLKTHTEDASVKIKAFIDYMVKAYRFNQKKLETWLNILPNKEILNRISHPYEKILTWDEYRNRFITAKRIKAGVKFWNDHQQSLSVAEKKYGIPTYIIVGILGVETNYATVKMHFKALDAITTLAFYYPPRAAFFKNELEAYLLLMRELGISPQSVDSSYAGALGIPQFMPSCYRKFAIASHPKHKADLIKNFDDSIFSIANYLKKRGGWETQNPVATPASAKKDIPMKLCSTDITFDHTLAYYQKKGVRPIQVFQTNKPATLIQLINNDQPTYWFVFPNFYAIMQYNPHIYYAMAVYELGKAITKARVETE